MESKIKLFPHNQKIYQAVLKAFQETKRTCIVQPTGTGKSFIALKYIEDHPFQDILYLSPSTYIFEHIQAQAPYGLLQNVTFMTYYRLHNLTNEEIESMPADMIFLDEFHRCGAKLWRIEVEYLLQVNPESYCLGMTATPVRFLDRPGPRNMVNELFDGRMASYYSLSDAVNDHILEQPTLVVTDVRIKGGLQELEKKVRKDKNVPLEQAVIRLKDILQNTGGIDKLFQTYLHSTTPKLIVFCRGISHIEEDMEQIRQWLGWCHADFHEYICHSQYADAEIDLVKFRDDTDTSAVRILYSVNMVNEGIHIEDVDGVVMLRPTISLIVYIQQIGRAMSAKSNRSPLIFDLMNNFNYALVPETRGVGEGGFIQNWRDNLSKELGPVHLEISGILEEFTDLVTRFNIYGTQLTWENWLELLHLFVSENERLPQFSETYNGFSLGRWYWKQVRKAQSGNLSEKNYQEIITDYIDAGLFTEDDWPTSRLQVFDSFCQNLQAFTAQNKRMPSAYSKNPQESFLGKRVLYYRMCYANEKLPSGQISRLKEVRVITQQDEAWIAQFSELKSFICIFHRAPTENDKQYAEIYTYYQEAISRYFKGTLYKSQADFLIDNHILAERYWDNRFKQLQDFIEKNGRPPKHSHKEKEEKSLYVWLKSAREKALTGKLEPSQYEQLNGLGLIPSHPVKQPAFEERVQELSDFIRKEIRLPNIDSDSKEERSLYHWFHVTRKKVENNKLPKDQAKLFRDAGLLDANPWRQKRDKIWNQHLQDLITFYKDNSRLPKFQEPVNGFQLRFWYRKTTNLAKEGKLEANQVKKLQEFQELLQKDVE